MRSIIRNILLSFSFAACILSQSQPEPSDLSVDGHQQFRELLEALPEQSIHAALHENLHPKYQDGVYQHDKAALEAVHSANPPLATRVLAVAALDLIKRQNVSTPTTSSTETTPTSPSGESTTETSSSAVVVPVEVSTTNSAGSTIVSTTSAVAVPSASVVVPVTTTNAEGSTIVTSSTVPAAIVVSNGVTTTSPVPLYTPPSIPTASSGMYDLTTTDSLGNAVVLSGVKSGQVLTTTDAKGSTFVTTFTPGGGRVSSLVLKTTTLPNGQQSTITSFAEASITTPTGTTGPTTSPHLQSGVAVPVRVGAPAIALIGGAVGAAILL